jgi:hypothetical protein
MRQSGRCGDVIHENSAKLPFDTQSPAMSATSAQSPLLFCGETARYYHRRFSTT